VRRARKSFDTWRVAEGRRVNRMHKVSSNESEDGAQRGESWFYREVDSVEAASEKGDGAEISSQR
jgi:hypothetical protein